MKKITAVSVAIVLGVVLSACGGSGSDASKKATATAAAEKADFGTLKNVCHPETSPNKANSDRGVTANTIQITTISDAGSSIQKGLNQELWDVATVFSKWCNEQGGINGRRIIVQRGDAQVTLYSQAIDQACASSFALVGGGGAMDELGQDARLTCLLPSIPAFTASSVASTASLIYPTQVTPLGQVTFGGLKTINKLYPGSFERAATVYGNFPSIKYVIDKDLSVAQGNFGTPPVPVFQDAYPVTGPSSWRSTVEGIKKYHVEGLMVAGQPTDIANLLVSIQASGYTGLKWVYSESNLYDQTFIKQAGGALAQIPFYTQIFVQPFENAGSGTGSSAIAEYLALFKKYLPEGKAKAMLGVSGFAAWLLFAKAANACGADLTRKCLVGQLDKVTSFDGGGLIAPVNPAEPSHASRCFTLVRATPSGFKQVPQVDPNRGVFNCSASNVFDLTDAPLMKAYPPGPTLTTVGKSLADLP